MRRRLLERFWMFWRQTDSRPNNETGMAALGMAMETTVTVVAVAVAVAVHVVEDETLREDILTRLQGWLDRHRG